MCLWPPAGPDANGGSEGGVCSICHSPARREIEAAVRSGTISLRAIARANGLSHQSIIRHRDSCRQLAPARHTHPPKWLTPELAAKPGARCEKCGGTSFWTNPLEGTGGCTVCWAAQFDHGRKSYYET